MTAFGIFPKTEFTGAISVGLPVITGLAGEVAEIGSAVAVSLFGVPPTGAIQWLLDGAPISGATEVTLTVPEADGGALSVTVDGKTSASIAIRHPAPLASSALNDLIFEENSGLQTANVSGDFSFAGAPLFTLSTAPSGVSIDGVSGVLSVETASTGVLASANVVVRCADAGAPMRFAESGFSLTITAVIPPNLSAASAAANGTDGFTGSVTTDKAGGTLYVLASQATSETAATIRAAGAGQAVGSSGPQAVSGAGLASATSYRLHFVHDDADGNASTVLSSGSFTTQTASTVPGGFTAGNWSVTDLATGGDARISITALPDDGGSAIQIIQYNIGGGWQPIGGSTTGDYDLLDAFTDGVATNVRLRAVNANGPGASSDTKSVTTSTASTAPASFTAGQWSVSDLATGGDARVSITALPDDGGSAIQIIQYNIGGGWQPIGGSATGDYDLIDAFTDGVATNVRLRAVNANGPGASSDTKSVTTSTASTAPASFTAGQWSVTDLATGGDARISITALPDDGGSAIQIIQYNIGGGWQPIGGNSTGDYDLIDAFTDGVATNVRLRAVNANGPGASSDTKSVTTSTASTLSVSETGDGEIAVDGASGAITVTITAPPVYATLDIGNGPGVFQANTADLASGPALLAPPQITGGGNAAAGVTLGSTKALWLYDEAGGAPVISRQWQADSGGDGSFANIAGATAASYTLSANEAGDDTRLRETATQNALGARNATSPAVSVASGGGGSATDAAISDTFFDSNDGQTYTLSGMNIGAADANRKVVVMFGAKANTSLGSVTIGGVAATALHPWDLSSNPDIAIYEASVPNGSTADLVITFDNSNPSGIFGAVIRYTSGTASAFASVEGQTASLDLSATISANGAFAAAIAVTEGNSATGWTWSGLTEALDQEFRGSGTDNLGSVAWASGLAAGARPVTASVDGSPNSGKSLGVLLEIV